MDNADAADARVWIGPDEDSLVAAGVRRGGGRVVALPDANAVVWMHREPEGLRSALHGGIRWVQLSVSGVDAWIADPILRTGPVFTSARGAYAHAVGEQAVALLLAGSRDLHTAARAETWRRPDTRMLRGATVAVVGAGAIGREVIRLLEPFGVRPVAVNRSGEPVPGAIRTLPATRLDEVWPVADYFVLAAPGTSDTRCVVGAAELRAMPRHAWLVNVGRGSLVDTEALVLALGAGIVRGAALDVTEPEPLPAEHPLWTQPRCLITSHSANPPEARRHGMAERVERNVVRWTRGEPLIGEIDLARGY